MHENKHHPLEHVVMNAHYVRTGVLRRHMS